MKPNELNFNVPGRFEEHFCTFITWPCRGDKEIDIFRKEIASVIKIISKYEKVIIIIDPEDLNNAKELCDDFADMWPIPTDMSWIRDNGPIFIRNNKMKLRQSTLNLMDMEVNLTLIRKFKKFLKLLLTNLISNVFHLILLLKVEV